jgi:hypothetical protein
MSQVARASHFPQFGQSIHFLASAGNLAWRAFEGKGSPLRLFRAKFKLLH